METTIVKHSNYEEFIYSIISAIDENSLILVPADIKNLIYYTEYKTKSHSHYFIVKGYNYNKKLFYILDNTHVDGGSSIVYKDFVIEFKKLYELNLLYCENFETNFGTYLWKLSKKNDVEIIPYDILKDHCILLKNNDNNPVGIEKDLLTIIKTNSTISSDALLYIVELFNSSSVYYNTLYKLFKLYLPNNEILDTFKYKFTTNLEQWHQLMILLVYQFQKSTFNYSQYEDQIKDLIMNNHLLNKTIIYIIENIKFEQKSSKSSNILFENGILINNHNAKISFTENSLKVIHSDTKTYDTWLAQDNAVQLLFAPEKNIKSVFEAKVSIYNHNINSFHNGIIIKTNDSQKLLFGLYKNQEIAAFIPEKESNNKVFSANYIKSSIYIKIIYVNNLCTFFTKENAKSQWIENYKIKFDKGVKYIGLFSKTWEKCNCESLFENITFKNL